MALIDQIVAWLAFDSGKVRGASNIGGLSEAADEFWVSAELGRGIRRGILDVACIIRHFRSCLQHNRCGGNHSLFKRGKFRIRHI